MTAYAGQWGRDPHSGALVRINPDRKPSQDQMARLDEIESRLAKLEKRLQEVEENVHTN